MSAMKLIDRVQANGGKVISFNKGKGFCNLINMPAPPIESALSLFRSDFECHLANGRCPTH